MNMKRVVSDFHVHVSLESLVPRELTGAVNGNVWITVDDIAFPAANWYDFPSSILEWWIRSVIGIRDGLNQSQFDFMDGPFMFVLTADGQDTWEIKLIERRASRNECILSAYVDQMSLMRELHSAACLVIDHADRLEFRSRDVERLRSARDRLATLLSVKR